MKTVNFEGYTIREDGKILGKFGKEIGNTNSKGYTYVTVNGKQMLRHRIVWMAFVGIIPEGLEIDHIIPIKNGGTDALSNLRLVTHQENCRNEKSKDNYKKSNSKYNTEEERIAARRESWKKSARKYYQENPEKVKEKQRKWREKNPDFGKQWYLKKKISENPDYNNQIYL